MVLLFIRCHLCKVANHVVCKNAYFNTFCFETDAAVRIQLLFTHRKKTRLLQAKFAMWLQTRLMNQRKLKKKGALLSKHIYKGTIDCFVQTFKHEGFWAFYKGFIPAWVRMGPWNIIFFVTYEQLKKLYWAFTIYFMHCILLLDTLY